MSLKGKNFKWAFIYWMPYNNDLCVHGDEILYMLTQGTQGTSNILVTVQADIHGNENHSRHTIVGGEISTDSLSVSNSADENVFAEFLHWNSTQFNAEKWAIIFLGHGEKLDRISPDLNAGGEEHNSVRWMSITKIKGVIDQFQQAIEQQIEMLFLQNCFKGTLETHYTLRNAARFTLSSPVLVGAPNEYYKDTLQFISENPSENGLALAQTIMEAEHEYMFHIYTVTENQYLHSLPSQLDPVIEAFLASKARNLDLDVLNQFEYFGETYVDVLEFLKLAASQSRSASALFDNLKSYWTSSLIRKVQYSSKCKYPELCGLTLLLPSTKSDLESYMYLPIYQDTELPALFRAILGD